MDKFRGNPRHILRLLALVGIYFLCQDTSDLYLGPEVKERIHSTMPSRSPGLPQSLQGPMTLPPNTLLWALVESGPPIPSSKFGGPPALPSTEASPLTWR